MSFLGLIAKNVWRQKIRSLLAVLGISIGIATIIALGAIANGMEKNLISALKSAKADFSIGQANATAIVLSAIPAERLKEIQSLPDVAEAYGALVVLSSFQDSPYFILLGADPDSFELAGIQLSAGRFYTPEATHEMMVGKSAASSPQLAVGQTVELDGQDFQIVGIYETGNVLLDGGALFPLKRLQELKRRIDQLTTIFVKAKPHTDINQLTQRIEQTYKNELITMRDLGDYNRSYQGTMLVRVGTWLISLLALVIGGIGVMNTMIMAVFERTREIGILRAVGWRRRRVLQMILGESLILGACAGVIGTLMGLGAIRLVTLLPNVRGFIGPSYTPTLFGEALLIALIVGLLGGLYPAFRATRILPQEALRYE